MTALKAGDEEQETDSSPPWPGGVYSWYVLILLFFGYTIAFLDRMILNLLIEPIRLDLSLSDTQMGLLSGASFALFYVTLGLPIGRLADKTNRRTMIAAGMALWSLMTALCGLAQGFWQLFLARMGVGIGEATLSPCATSLISDYFPPSKRARAMAVYASGISFGLGLSLIIGGQVFTAVSDMDLPSIWMVGVIRPWQAAFLVVSVPGILLAMLVFSIREPVRRGVQNTTNDVSLRDVFAFVGENRRTFNTLFATFAATSALTYGVSAWMAPYFMRTHDWTVGEVGWTYGWIMLLCGPLGTLAGGWFADWLRKKGHKDANLRTTCIAMFVLAPIGFFAPIAPNIEVTVAAFSLFWFVASVPLSLGYATLQEIVPNEMRGTASALLLFATTISGMGLGPTVIALLTDYAFSGPADLKFSISIVAGVMALIAAGTALSGCSSLRSSVRNAAVWQNQVRQVIEKPGLG